MTQDITSLIEKLEGAEVGTKELGIELLLHFGWHRNQVGNFYGPLYQWSAPDRTPCLISGDEDRLPNPVTSLDAALALAERVLPGARVMTERFHDGKGWAMVQRVPESAKIMMDGNTPALALCAAILRAQLEAR